MDTGEASSLFVELLRSEVCSCDLAADVREFAAGSVIFREGDPGDGLYVILEGCVKVSAVVGQAGRRVLCEFGPGDFFGEMALIDSGARSATATAETSCRLSFLSSGEVLKLLETTPQSVSTLLRVFSSRTRDFNRVFVQEVLAADRLATFGRFARSIVHDIKNPLNIIGMASDMASHETATMELRREAQQGIRQQVDKIVRMLNEMLRMTEGPVTQNQVPKDFAVFLEEALEEARFEMETRRILFELPDQTPSVTVKINTVRFNHALANLFNNAADFMPDGGRIILQFEVQQDEIQMRIEDTGPGFGEGVAERLFTPFFTSGKPNGTGLGLSICRNIIEDHGGRIWAVAEQGRGAIFCLALPLDKS
jgi:signal transduction histidine kinase